MLAPESILDLAPPPPGERIAYGRDPHQFAELRRPKPFGVVPVVIFIHGGYWRARYDLTHTGHLCVALNKAGWATWSLEYRRLGHPGGGWPGTFDDVLAGARRLMAMDDIDRQRIVVAGHSAGGHLALWMAARKVVPLVGVTALAGITDLRRAHELGLSNGVVSELLGGSPEDQPERYTKASPIEMLPIAARQRLLHGRADQVAPFELSERFARASKNAELVALDGAGHFELIDPRAACWAAVEQAITQW